MGNLYKDPMGDGSKFWAGDILTSTGDVADIEMGSNANGDYIIFPSGLCFCFYETDIDFASSNP